MIIKSAISTFIGLLFIGMNILNAQNFKATYLISYQNDSTNVNSKRQEKAHLFIGNNELSSYATENFFKQDSILRLVISGRVTPDEVMSDKSNIHNTKFNQFIRKGFQNEITVFEKINSDTYKYDINSSLWDILDTSTVINTYICTKAVTHFGGRDYEAWFTADIPVSDGPYVFSGLPGLIVKINDVKSYYTFELIGFEPFDGEIITTVAKDPAKIIVTSREKVFEIREGNRKDPIGSFDKSLGWKSILTPEMKEEAKKKIAANNNPLELSVD